MKALVTRLLAEPLCQFLILGALMFLGYSMVSNATGIESGAIVVTQGRIENLAATFARTRQRPPTEEELVGLIQDFVREEVFYREAIALGLDRDDTIIRRRLRQKLEFVANDTATRNDPNDGELKEFLAEHPDLFRFEPRFSFRQIYLNPDRRHGTLRQDATRLLAQVNQAGTVLDFQQLGDTTLLSPELVDVRATEVTAQFGEDFMRQLSRLPVGRWQGPVKSGYGVHLVRLDERKPGRMPELQEVRAQVVREWADARRRESNEAFYQNLLKRYVVTIEQAPIAARTNVETAQVRR